MLALDWCEKTFPASLAGFKSESNSYVLRLLEALAGQGPALALLRGQGCGGVYNAIDPTEIKILIRCYLYSAKLPRTRTGRVRHSKFDCTENKDVLFREKIIKEPRLWGSKPLVSRSCFLGFLILALFRLQNIQHRWVIAPYFLRFPPFQNFHLLTFTLPLPLPLLPQLSRAPFPFLSSIIGTKFLLVQILLYKTKPVHNHTR